MAALVHLLRVHVNNCLPGVTHFEDEKAKELLNLFEFFLEKFSLQGINGELNSTFGLENWRDRYGMTFLMRLFSDNEDSLYVSTKRTDLLIKCIIEGKYFDDEYIKIEADVELATQFELQHRLGVKSVNKKKNLIISTDQLMKVKRIERLNVETGQYEKIVPDKSNHAWIQDGD